MSNYGLDLQSSEWLLELPKVTGSLAWRTNSIDLACSLRIGRNGYVALDFEPVRVTEESKWALDIIGAKRRFTPWLRLKGEAPEGIKVTSDHVSLKGYELGRDAEALTIRLSGEASRLRIQYRDVPPDVQAGSAIYSTVGMLGYRIQTAASEVGSISLAGPSKITDFSLINGALRIDAGDSRALDGWIAACDEVVDRILDMVSLAEGRLVRWSVRRLDERGEIIFYDFRGPQVTNGPQDEVLHFLNLQPVLDLALGSYTKELQEETGLRVALQWFVYHPRYLEVQLITAFSALEHLVSVNATKVGGVNIASKNVFDALLPKLKKPLEGAIASAPAAADESAALRRLKDKVSQLNDGSLQDRISNLVMRYGVPVVGIAEHISKAVQARNDVVHRGLYDAVEKNRDIYVHVVVVRELLKRIFLTLLGYQGQYQTMLNGPEWTTFPPTDVTLQLDQD